MDIGSRGGNQKNIRGARFNAKGERKKVKIIGGERGG